MLFTGYLQKKSYVSRETRAKKQNWRNFLGSHAMKDLKLGCELRKCGEKRRASIRNKINEMVSEGGGSRRKTPKFAENS